MLALEWVVVGHASFRVNKFRIFGGEFRNRLCRYGVVADLVCGVVNFKITGILFV